MSAAHHGHLMVIGGHEDRSDDMTILQRFIELSGGSGANIVVISAASRVPDDMWAMYEEAFGTLGVENRTHLEMNSRMDASDSAILAKLHAADGIFFTGGDQKRLLANIGGTPFDAAIHAAYVQRGACIAGTSAGASAMSGHMLAAGRAGLKPEKGTVSLGAGLGLLHGVVIDQHFSERHRLARLLTVVAQNPYLLGIGIDEDTALVVKRGAGIEVCGQGAVTVVDGHAMFSTMADVSSGDCPQLIDVRLHLLPPGTHYGIEDSNVPPALLPFLQTVTRAIADHEADHQAGQNAAQKEHHEA